MAGIRHDIGRIREIARVMARYGFAPTVRRIPGLAQALGEASPASQELLAKPAAERFASMLEELGPTFVKLGQILSTRADILPTDFVAALSRLQDQVPPFAFVEVQKTIQREFGRSIEELYASFDEKPMASASMAQVHTATLYTGESVVVKVQRPEIAEQVKSDGSLLVLLAQFLEMVVAEASTYGASDLAREFEEGMRAELDFSLEAQNLLAFSRLNATRSGVHIPKLFQELSGRTVMTMERIYGYRITDLPNVIEHINQVRLDQNMNDPISVESTMTRLLHLGFEHIFTDGLFHGDPHPGNVLVTQRGDLAFIDFGLVGRISRDLQDRLLYLLLALSLRDADTLSRLVVRIGIPSERVQLQPLRDAIAHLMERYTGLAISQVNPALALRDLVDLSTRFGIRLPRELALLSKSLVALEGIVRMLYPTLDPTPILSDKAEDLLVARLDPRRIKGGGLRSALHLSLLLDELPLQLGQTLLDLERGNLQVRIGGPDVERLLSTLRSLGMTVVSGMVSSSLILGGFFALARTGGSEEPVRPVLVFVLAGLILGTTLTLLLTGGRLPKISLSGLVRRLLSQSPPPPNRPHV